MNNIDKNVNNCIYDVEFICDNNIYGVTLTLSKDIRIGKAEGELDYLLVSCIDVEKEMHGLAGLPHTVTSIRKSINNGLDREDMI